MPSPIRPSDISGVVSSPNSTLCGNFTDTLLRLPTLLAQWWAWAFTSTGAVTTDFRREFIPSGDLIFSASNTESDHRLLCNGQAVDRTTYAALFNAIGIAYGPGNGSTTFNVPDYRARFPVGVGSFTNLGPADIAVAGGEDQVELTIEQAGLDHIHTTGRFHSTSGPGRDDFAAVVTDADMGNGALATLSANGEANATVAGTLGGYTGKYAVTPPASKADATDVEPEAHNNLPPFLPCYILIAT